MPRTKQTPTDPSAALKLPDHITLSEEETVQVARLIRVLRTEHWLRYFIPWLLKKDAAMAENVTIAQAEAMLGTMKSLEDWTVFLARVKDKFDDAIHNHPAVRWVDGARGTRYFPESDEEEFIELVKMWRLEHPEPAAASDARDEARRLAKALQRSLDENKD